MKDCGKMKNHILQAVMDFEDVGHKLDLLYASYNGGELQVFEDIDTIDWGNTKQGFVFCFNENGHVLIRHIDEGFQKHKQIILEDGYRICVEDWEGMSLCLYRNKENIMPYPTNREDFSTSLLMLWDDNKEKWTNEGQNT